MHTPPWLLLLFAKSTCLSNCSVLLSHSAITFCNWCSDFFLIKYQSWLLLSHSILTRMAAALLIIDFIFTFYYDVICGEFDPFISLFVANYVWQICLEEWLLLCLGALVSSKQRWFLLRGLLLVWRYWCHGQVITEFDETTFAVLFAILSILVRILWNFLNHCLFSTLEAKLFFMIKHYQILWYVVAEIECLLVLTFVYNVYRWKVRNEWSTKFLLILTLMLCFYFRLRNLIFNFFQRIL